VEQWAVGRARSSTCAASVRGEHIVSFAAGSCGVVRSATARDAARAGRGGPPLAAGTDCAWEPVGASCSLCDHGTRSQ